jgi:hypothetical protein
MSKSVTSQVNRLWLAVLQGPGKNQKGKQLVLIAFGVAFAVCLGMFLASVHSIDVCIH